MRLRQGFVRAVVGVLAVAGVALQGVLAQPDPTALGPAFAQIDVPFTPTPGGARPPGPSGLPPPGGIPRTDGLPDALPPGLIPEPFLPRQEPPFQCPPPQMRQQPVVVDTVATSIPLYQPPPWQTGEINVVANTAGFGATFRVAPRPRARAWRVIPEGETLETVGADIVVDTVPWAYVRDRQGVVGWVVAHELRSVAQLPGGPSPQEPRGSEFGACPTPTFTPTPGGLILISITTPTPTR